MKLCKLIRGLLAFVVTLALTALPAQARVWKVDAPGLQRAIEVQELHSDTLMAQPGVVGTAVGLREDGTPVVKIYTEHVFVRGLPDVLGGVPVIPEVSGRIYARTHKPNHPDKPTGGDTGGAALDPTSRFARPVPIGVSTGHPAITAGTIGARVVDLSGNLYTLSNNHVYADENGAALGDPVIQPGTFDGGATPLDEIGTLADFEPIVFSTSANNLMDVAMALTTNELSSNASPGDGYGLPRSLTIAPVVGMGVMKYGRTTGLTKGKIDAINATVNVGYSTGTARFVGQIIITPGRFSDGGDSGSLIVVDGAANAEYQGDDRKPVGLLFAGSKRMTIASPIQPVLDRFRVTIDGD